VRYLLCIYYSTDLNRCGAKLAAGEMVVVRGKGGVWFTNYIAPITNDNPTVYEALEYGKSMKSARQPNRGLSPSLSAFPLWRLQYLHCARQRYLASQEFDLRGYQTAWEDWARVQFDMAARQ